VWVDKLHGTEAQPIVIEGSDERDPPRFRGGQEGWHFSDCSYLILRNVTVQGQTGNGINADDGGSSETPAHHLVLERIRVQDIGPRGNHDAIKLSGVDDFILRDCTLAGWGGQAIDMVGCHQGLIERCRFVGQPGYSQDSGVQTKGGSRRIVVRDCHFRNGGGRAVNVGGSTGLDYFRPRGVGYEAQEILVEGCTFVGSLAPIAFVGVDGAVVRYNTIYHPDKWVLRILQETNAPGFLPCRRGRFENNLIVFRREAVQVIVNIGPNTQPESFTFSQNLWYCQDRPDASRPELPARETGGIYGVDPRLKDPPREMFQPQEPRAAGVGATAWRAPPRG
jgi:hypothetical protein